MSAITATTNQVIDIYNGDVANSVLPAGPCNVLFSVTAAGDVDRVCFLSETDAGHVTLSVSISNTISKSQWLTDAAVLQPIEVLGISLTQSVITASGSQVNPILGNLQDGIVLHTLSGNKVNAVALCIPARQAEIALGFSIPANEQLTEAEWLTVRSASRLVDSINLASVE